MSFHIAVDIYGNGTQLAQEIQVAGTAPAARARA
jgi:hypothetical protein